MTWVVILSILLLITTLAVYKVIDKERQQRLALEKQYNNERITNVSQSLKLNLQEYIALELLTPKQLAALLAITNNFFVVQPRNEQNITYLEFISAELMASFATAQQHAALNNQEAQLEEKINDFINELPTKGVDYNYGFYHDYLPVLLLALTAQNPSPSHEEEIDQDQESNERAPPLATENLS